MNHLGIKRAHLIGYSMGGGVVAKVAVTHPERLITAILGGHSGYREWEPGDEKYYEDSARELETDVPFRSLVSSPGLTGSKPTEEQIRALSASLAAENDVKALAALRRGGDEGPLRDARASGEHQGSHADDLWNPRRCRGWQGDAGDSAECAACL